MNQQMGRMALPKVQIKQWQISIKQVAKVLAKLLGLSADISYKAGQKSIALGALKTKTGRKSILLNIEPLTLMVNQSELPINEVLYFEGDRLLVDKDRVNHVLNLKQQIVNKTYTANTDKRAQSKANTQAMYQSWQDEYEKLKRKHPNKPNQPKKTKGWYVYKISKMDISQGATVANITRNIIS
jgi:hypothetical protein